MKPSLPGLHHVTAVTAKPQENLDFYTQTLGLRLVKRTVNFDDPGAYHFYYGDRTGTPGTILTFFGWLGASPARIGAPQVSATALAVPGGSLEYWRARLEKAGVQVGGPESRLDEQVLSLVDPDGMPLELVADPSLQGTDIHGIHGVTLSLADPRPTVDFLTQGLGFKHQGSDGRRYRLQAAGPFSIVDVLAQPGPPGSPGAGGVHHVAFRTPDDESQALWKRSLALQGRAVSPVMDRSYFHSIYFREPGGVLFEIATDPPGFAVDEAVEGLGSRLCLPPALEAHRPRLEPLLPPLRLPSYRL